MKAPEVRVLGGRWKGRRLPAGPRARPTSSRARKALFDILAERIAGARVLDLYAGSGAIGLEAVSRGARHATLVEPDCAPLRRTVERFGAAPSEVLVVGRNAGSALDDLARARERFDLVFADPPYSEPLEPGILARMAALLSDGGLLVLQRDAGQADPEVEGLRPVDRRAYGRNVFYLFGMR